MGNINKHIIYRVCVCVCALPPPAASWNCVAHNWWCNLLTRESARVTAIWRRADRSYGPWCGAWYCSTKAKVWGISMELLAQQWVHCRGIWRCLVTSQSVRDWNVTSHASKVRIWPSPKHSGDAYLTKFVHPMTEIQLLIATVPKTLFHLSKGTARESGNVNSKLDTLFCRRMALTIVQVWTSIWLSTTHVYRNQKVLHYVTLLKLHSPVKRDGLSTLLIYSGEEDRMPNTAVPKKVWNAILPIQLQSTFVQIAMVIEGVRFGLILHFWTTLTLHAPPYSNTLWSITCANHQRKSYKSRRRENCNCNYTQSVINSNSTNNWRWHIERQQPRPRQQT